MSDVPCNGCTVCCRQQIVLLGDRDEPNIAAYDYRHIGDHRVLNNKPNGECTHLGPEGCTIYEKRPFVCRTYDCRKQFKILASSERRRFSNSALGDEARKRLGTLDAGDLADLPNYPTPVMRL
jgi:Fe-S-cluster containining protein